MVVAARVVAVLLAIVEGAWMTFDGGRALIVGDYVTPASRPGELGPWHYAVEAIGVGPRSTLMKILFVLFGIAWIVLAIGLTRRAKSDHHLARIKGGITARGGNVLRRLAGNG